MGKTCWDDSKAATPEQNEELEREVAGLLNRVSRENVADVPDFILARVMVQALVAFEGTVQARDRWFGFKAWGNERPVEPEGEPIQLTE
jgi:hypothetical protein